ncbi:uncharacterized protein [Palaemon carinicauda]|uniref:uncharacterized protein n=1 Tax=Palaemon carinicauda TaxID=392227 RepID=UPI0035B62D48
MPDKVIHFVNSPPTAKETPVSLEIIARLQTQTREFKFLCEDTDTALQFSVSIDFTSTRDVTIEVTTSQTATEFVQAVHKFAARFGMPHYIVLDNASIFPAGQALLTELMHHPVIDGFKSSHNLSWKFSTSCAPWLGGFYETLISFAKLNLRKAIYHLYPTFNEFVTEVQNEVNDTPLNPSHLLYG